VEQEEDVACENCKSKEHADQMLLCDNCDFGYHMLCLNPPLYTIPETNWYCSDCQNANFNQEINVGL
jgi:hypothetical protein